MIFVDEWRDLRGRLSGVLARQDDRLSVDDARLIHEFIDVGECGLALEQIADVLSEDKVALRDDERTEMLALNARMEMGDRVPDALGLCPTFSVPPAGDST